jgi:hypothetical protein
MRQQCERVRSTMAAAKEFGHIGERVVHRQRKIDVRIWEGLFFVGVGWTLNLTQCCQSAAYTSQVWSDKDEHEVRQA